MIEQTPNRHRSVKVDLCGGERSVGDELAVDHRRDGHRLIEIDQPRKNMASGGIRKAVTGPQARLTIEASEKETSDPSCLRSTITPAASGI